MNVARTCDVKMKRMFSKIRRDEEEEW